jgi:hypothetical protein
MESDQQEVQASSKDRHHGGVDGLLGRKQKLFNKSYNLLM